MSLTACARVCCGDAQLPLSRVCALFPQGIPADSPFGRHLCRQLVAAVCELAAAQILHRDLKPANIMLQPCKEERTVQAARVAAAEGAGVGTSMGAKPMHSAFARSSSDSSPFASSSCSAAAAAATVSGLPSLSASGGGGGAQSCSRASSWTSFVAVLIDYGVSDTVERVALTHTPARPLLSAGHPAQRIRCGSLHYASCAAHLLRMQTIRDELEAICFVLLHALCGGLPWGDVADAQQVYHAKVEWLQGALDAAPKDEEPGGALAASASSASNHTRGAIRRYYPPPLVALVRALESQDGPLAPSDLDAMLTLFD